MRDASSASPRGAEWIVVSLYLGQGLLAGVWAGVLTPHLQRSGVTVEAMAGMLAWGGLPWVLKLAVGPAVDRLLPPGARRHKRNALLTLQLALAACALGLDLADTTPDGLQRITRVWFLANLCMSVQDVITDATAIDQVPAHRIGRVRGWMLLAAAVGTGLFGGAGLGSVATVLGTDALRPILAGTFLALAVAVGVLGRGWSTSSSTAPPPLDPSPIDRIHGWRAPRAVLSIGLAAALWLPNGMVSTIGGYYLLGELAWTVERYQTVLLPYVSIVSALTYLSLGQWLERVGVARAIMLGALSTATPWLVFALTGQAARADALFFPLATMEAFGLAVLLGGIHAWLMLQAPARQRAGYFAVGMAGINAAQLLAGPMVASALQASWGARGIFASAAVIQITLVLVLLNKSD